MANTPLLSLPVAASVDGTEYAWIVQGGVDKRATIQQISNTAQGFVPTSRSITAGVGLSGGGTLASDVTLSFDSAELTPVVAMAVTDSFVINSGLTSAIATFPFAMKAIGGLTVSPALNLAADKLMVYRAADGLVYYTTPSAIGTAAGNMPAGGTTGQFLVKASNTDYDTTWSSSISGFANDALSNLASVAINTTLLPGANDGAGLGSGTFAFSDLFLASGGVVNWNNGDVTITHAANSLAFAGASSGYSFDAVVLPSANDAAALGAAATSWADLFLASGGVINWNNGNVTITHSANLLTFAGATNGYRFNVGADATVAFGIQGLTRGARFITTTVGTTIEGVDNTLTGSFQPMYIGGLSLGFTISGTEEVSLSATALFPTASDGNALGSTTNMWADLFLASGGVINWNNGTLALTQSSTVLRLSPGILTIGSTATGDPTNTGVLRLVDGGEFATNSGLEFQNASGGGGYGWKIVAPDRTAGNTPLAFGYRSAAATWTEAVRFRPDVTAIETVGFAIRPSVNDAAALGSGTLSWSDLYLASGAFISFNNGAAYINHSGTSITVTATDLALYRSGGAPNFYVERLDTHGNAANVGVINLTGRDSAAASQVYASITGYANTATAGSEVGQMFFGAVINNVLTNFVTVHGATPQGALLPYASDGTTLGNTSFMWADLFLASGGVINFNAGNVTLTHSANTIAANFGASNPQYFGRLNSNTTYNVIGLNNTNTDASVIGLVGGGGADAVLYLFAATGGSHRFRIAGNDVADLNGTAFRPTTNDAIALGSATISFADLFLASGGVINWNNGNATLTHSTNLITSNRPWAFGAAGSIVGTLQLFNATSGSITITPTTGALGTITLTLPAISGTVLQTAGNQTITGGFAVTPYNAGTYNSTGGFTVTPANGNYQYCTLGSTTGSFTFTLTAPASDCAVDILVINGGSASTITFAFSGFKTAGTGASGSTFTAANNNWYVLSVRRINSVSTYSWSGPWT